MAARRATGLIEGQESLIVASTVNGEMHTRDFDAEYPAVDLVEHSLQQLNALNIFALIHQKEWMISHPDQVKQSYPKNHDQVLATTLEQRKSLESEAEAEFKRSIGFFAVKESGLVEEIKPYEIDAKHRWNVFQARFRGIRKNDARLAETTRLIETVKELSHNRTVFNREHDLRPHAPNKEAVKRAVEDVQPEIRTLSTRERLIAINEDPRAGFLPANNDEKNKVLVYLDYLDNPEYPLGINNQLLEVFIHQQHLEDKPNGLDLARQAMVSLTYEMGDHLINATQSLEHLRNLDEIVSDCPNPKLRLIDIAGEDHPAFGALIRYRDLKLLRDKGTLPVGIKDPLCVKEDRRPHDEPGKNKTLEDTYTQAVLSDVMGAYISSETEQYTIGKTRMLVKHAIKDQLTRQTFMLNRLRDLERAPDARNLPMWSIARTILEKLEQPLKVQ